MNKHLVRILSDLDNKKINHNDAYYEILKIFDSDYCINEVKNIISNGFTDICRKNLGKKICDIPEAVKHLDVIEFLNK